MVKDAVELVEVAVVALRRPTIVPAFFLLESYLRKKTT
jgi:hypothetical protein